MHTIYAGKTLNGLEVNDMIDNDRDIVFYSVGNVFFTRITTIVEKGKDIPGMAIFLTDFPYEPLYAKKIIGISNTDIELAYEGQFTKAITDFQNTFEKEFFTFFGKRRKVVTFGFLYKNLELLSKYKKEGNEQEYKKLKTRLVGDLSYMERLFIPYMRAKERLENNAIAGNFTDWKEEFNKGIPINSIISWLEIEDEDLIRKKEEKENGKRN